jgi:hypothetical protein
MKKDEKVEVLDLRLELFANGRGNPNKNGQDAVDQERKRGLTALPQATNEKTGKENTNLQIMKKNVRRAVNEQGEKVLVAFPAISADAVRSYVYKTTLQSDVAQIKDPFILARLAAAPSALLRGYLMAEYGANRSSPVSFSRLDGDAVITCELGTKQGLRDNTSMVWREQIGDVNWTGGATIRFNDMAFLPLDSYLNKMIVPLSAIEDFILELNRLYAINLSKDNDVALYRSSAYDDSLPVRGLLLPEKVLKELTESQLRAIIKAEKSNATSEFQFNKIKVFGTAKDYERVELGEIARGPDMDNQIRGIMDKISIVVSHAKADTAGVEAYHKRTEANEELSKAKGGKVDSSKSSKDEPDDKASPGKRGRKPKA